MIISLPLQFLEVMGDEGKFGISLFRLFVFVLNSIFDQVQQFQKE